MTSSLDALLHPRSVAVIGASDTPGRIGGRPISNMLTTGYAGRIFPINPKYQTVQGLPGYATLAEVPDPVDCAIIAVPAVDAVQAMRGCADAGVKAVVAFTSGFAEHGEAGARAQRELSAIAREAGIRLVGPNCLGVFSVRENWFGTFASVPSMGPLKAGPVGMISQSGAYGSHMFMVAQARGVGVDHWVTTGNEADVDVAEVIAHYVAEPAVKVIVAYAEGVQDMGRMIAALDAARAAQKPVIFMKVGRSGVGAAAAASHTASLAGSDALYDALFQQHGVYRADTTEELVDIAYACQFGIFPRGRRVSLQTISGGVGVQMADAADAKGLDVAPLPEATQAKLKALIPFAGVRNPVDFTGKALAEPDLMTQNISLTIDEADYHSHVIYVASVPAAPFTREVCQRIFAELRDKYPHEVMVMSLIAPPEVRQFYEELNIPCFEDPSLAVRALAALTRFGEVFAAARRGVPPAPPPGAMAVPGSPVNEYEAKRILASWGLPVTEDVLAASSDQAVDAWRTIQGPVVMKIASPDILHKTEIGGVLLGAETAEAVRRDFAALMERAHSQCPDARIEGVIVAPLIRGGVETVLGVVRDPLFGPAVMFGLGGVFVETLGDVAFRLAPFDEQEARCMIDSIRGRAILDGARGAPPADVDALAGALAALSVFAAENADALETIDVNPFVVLPEGAVALDALIVPSQVRDESV